ncbi:MAG: hypothetical protein ACXV5J_02275 [Candidatus Angelobacter sp.]
MRTALLLMLVANAIVLSVGFAGAAGSDEKASGHPYTNTELGFTYTPPGGLRDLTEALKESDSAGTRDVRVRFESLLRMFSGPDDHAADWVTLGIATYPRGRDKDKGDDVTAGFFTNKALGGGATTKREVMKIAGRDFSVSNFEKKEPPLTKYAIVYTVVHKEKFISFFFSGNDREAVQRLAKSMDTLKFQP